MVQILTICTYAPAAYFSLDSHCPNRAILRECKIWKMLLKPTCGLLHKVRPLPSVLIVWSATQGFLQTTCCPVSLLRPKPSDHPGGMKEPLAFRALLGRAANAVHLSPRGKRTSLIISQAPMHVLRHGSYHYHPKDAHACGKELSDSDPHTHINSLHHTVVLSRRPKVQLQRFSWFKGLLVIVFLVWKGYGLKPRTRTCESGLWNCLQESWLSLLRNYQSYKYCYCL